MSKKKGLDIDTQKIVAWCKSNVVLVILVVVCIVAIIGLPQLGAGVTAEVKDSLQQRAKNFSKIEALTNTSVTLPGSMETFKVAVNQALVDEYTAVSSALRGDAEQVVRQAMAMNQKDYGVLFTEEPRALFPDPSKSDMETLPQQFHEALAEEYSSLLQSVNAGTPISQRDLASYLEDARVRFMETNLSTKHDAMLTKDQRASLEKHLSKLRMARLRTNAEDLGLYLNEDILHVPHFDDAASSPPIEVLFGWQWRYWLVADTVGAIAEINGGQSVLTSPIKRVVFMDVSGVPALPAELSSDEGDRGRGGTPGSPPGGDGGFVPPPEPPRGGGGGKGGPVGGRPPGGGPVGGRPPSGGGPVGGRPPSGGSGSGAGSRPPKGGGPVSPSGSISGRASGGMFDIVNIRLRCIVDTQRIPTILDGFSSYNFLTVVDLDMRTADKFDALADGFDYGPAGVSELTVEFESVWLRSWTTVFMPASVKTLLGIPVDEK